MSKLTYRLTKPEYLAAVRAEHGNARRYLSGCRCDRCDTPGNHRFSELMRRLSRVS